MALRAGDAKGVEAALKALAVQDPSRAQMLLDLLKTALHIAQASNGDTNA
jgi:membrane-bound lytic murein transglycosylase B